MILEQQNFLILRHYYSKKPPLNKTTGLAGVLSLGPKQVSKQLEA